MHLGARICPLCDEALSGPRCDVHDVPAIDLALLDAPRTPVAAGSVMNGRYRVERALGAGGMAETFVASDLTRGAPCVLKVPHAAHERRAHHVRRLYQEARMIRGLDHPVIVRLLDFGVDETSGQPFVVMELVPGVSVFELVRSFGPLDEPSAVALVRALAPGLDHAHARGALHRDLTPANVMIDPSQDPAGVRILDFGLARFARDDTPALTSPGASVGTPQFMAPEQITGGSLDGRTDLYALGCLLHFVLTRRAPFGGTDAVSMMQAHLTSPIPPLPEALADGHPPSPGLAALHRALLAKGRLERPESGAAAMAIYDAASALPAPTPARREAALTRLHAIAKAATEPAQRPSNEEPRTLVLPKPLAPDDAPAETPAAPHETVATRLDDDAVEPRSRSPRMPRTAPFARDLAPASANEVPRAELRAPIPPRAPWSTIALAAAPLVISAVVGGVLLDRSSREPQPPMPAVRAATDHAPTSPEDAARARPIASPRPTALLRDAGPAPVETATRAPQHVPPRSTGRDPMDAGRSPAEPTRAHPPRREVADGGVDIPLW